jgi:oxygen-dependent protoporphyrinogen oxidase
LSTIVIGGGITGLSAALELVRQDRRVTLIEPAPFGGLLRTERFDGCTVECGADSWLRSKPALRNLAIKLGLADDVLPCNEDVRRTFILRGGKLLPLPSGLRFVAPTKWTPILFSPLLGWRTKLRMLLEARRRPSPAGDRTVAEFVHDHFGEEALEYLAEPLFAGVYGGTPETLGVAGVLPGLFAHERAYGSLTRGVRRESPVSGPLFESMRNGLGSIPDAVVKSLEGKAEFVRAAAEAVEPGRVLVAGNWIEAEKILLACGAPSASRLLDGSAAGELLGRIAHSSATIFVLGFDRRQLKPPPQGFGFLVPRRERQVIMAATWVTNKFPHRAPEDKVVLRCFVAGDHSAGLLGEVRADLRRITGIVADPWFTRVYRWPDSMPQYAVGHAALVEEIGARLPAGIQVAGAFQRGVGMPDCVQSGVLAAKLS